MARTGTGKRINSSRCGWERTRRGPGSGALPPGLEPEGMLGSPVWGRAGAPVPACCRAPLVGRGAGSAGPETPVPAGAARTWQPGGVLGSSPARFLLAWNNDACSLHSTVGTAWAAGRHQILHCSDGPRVGECHSGSCPTEDYHCHLWQCHPALCLW